MSESSREEQPSPPLSDGPADLHIALYQPLIPHNTGAVGRLCVVSGATLHLIEPLGFSLDNKYLRRSGLDYWGEVKLYLHPHLTSFLEQIPGPLYYLSSHAQLNYAQMSFPRHSSLLFGNEVDGLPLGSPLLRAHLALRIPMASKQRCHNLANSVAIVAYEVLRQQGFAGLC